MLKIFPLLFIFVILPLNLANAAEWQMNPETSNLNFTASIGGDEFTGSFNDFTADIRLDPEELEDANIHITIDMTSFDAGNADRNSTLPNADWFHNRAFPSAEFTSNNITHQGGNNYIAAGTLTIKDISHEIELPFTLDIAGDIAHAKGDITLNRMDYDIGTGSWANDNWISFGVKVNFDINATR